MFYEDTNTNYGVKAKTDVVIYRISEPYITALEIVESLKEFASNKLF